MNYITDTNDTQELAITVRSSIVNGDSLNVTTMLTPENNENITISLPSSIIARGYYTTLNMNTTNESLELSTETQYNMTITDSNDNVIYRGKALATSQDVSNYVVYNNDFTSATSSEDNNFIIFE